MLPLCGPVAGQAHEQSDRGQSAGCTGTGVATCMLNENIS
jgi:hypothetical protein